ncbi:hypothetical protein JYP49_05095 [Nitratireductor aquimarinus]|uniref:hypothetical protein n=1 Tax=Nitratireductor TaxID=245876 RepID=UPI0019D404FA|nr:MULTISPECIES: hypothetical protein [Nitratireductor]MBN7775096.1 hypothetical protein [Nitratireductor pacificus]MBN7779957.1 hypothetical protein [Nitratireductor pacificus]MBN7788764.1 hypothetical protein [Nitratireductor aquimarinus]MBY6097483.1 hypothetical protein [Nitratireductor aquimarinus]MCA1260902.1 hypothetical protein [Nitratireductor aquimarinus]
MHDKITVLESGTELTFTFDQLLTFHGGGFPGGVVHGLKAMQAAFPLLSDGSVERREISILTAFSGPGGRDALEAVTRALTDDRLMVDRSIGGKDVISDLPGPYLFRFSYRGRTAEATIKAGHVREEFVLLGAKKDKSPEEITRHEALKSEMAQRLLPLPADEIYNVRVLADTQA